MLSLFLIPSDVIKNFSESFRYRFIRLFDLLEIIDCEGPVPTFFILQFSILTSKNYSHEL